MDAVMIGDGQTNISLFAGDSTWPVEARFTSPWLNAHFRGGDLNCDIVQELTAIYEARKSQAVIETEDGFISVQLKRDHLGHIEVEADGRRYVTPEIHARMRFEIDQSYLPPAIAAARRIFKFGFRQ